MTTSTAPPKPPPRKPPPTSNHAGTPTAGVMPTIRQPGTAVIKQPWRLILNGVEGFGKTTVGAYCPSPLIVMADNETGYLTLLENGRVPDVPSTICGSWTGVLGLLDAIPDGVKTLVFDALGGIERLCQAHVCEHEFKNDWGERGYAAYGRGNEVSASEWRRFIAKLDEVRKTRGVNVLFLSHVIVKTFNNPEGANFDRYRADCHDKTWGITAKWVDSILFANFFTAVSGGSVGDGSKQASKGKGIGATQRVIYTQRRAAFDAKDRYGMRESFDLPDDPAMGWATIESEMKGESDVAA